MLLAEGERRDVSSHVDFTAADMHDVCCAAAILHRDDIERAILNLLLDAPLNFRLHYSLWDEKLCTYILVCSAGHVHV